MVRSTEQIRAEIAAMREQMAIRYRSGEQYAVDNAVLAERNRLLQNGTDLLRADTIEYLNSVAERARVDYQHQTSSLSFVDTIRQRADEALRQMGTLQSNIADGVMRLGEGIADNLFDMAMSGKASFAEMTASILADIARMITRMLVMKAISAAFGVPGLANGGVISPSAMGHAFDGARRFAQGSAFANTVVNNPTLFRFGKGGSQLGMMGEAGPEAVMPLTRMPNGKLGVEAMGGGGGVTQHNIFSPNITINAPPSTGNPQMDMEQAHMIAKTVKDVMRHEQAEFEKNQYRSSNRLAGQMRRPN